MSPKKTPLQVVTQEHGGKEKLVDRIVDLVERGEEGKDDLKSRLLAASNRKLLRLAAIAEEIKSRYGSRERLAEAVAGLQGKARDNDYVKKLKSFTPGRLLDLARSLSRRAGVAQPAAEAKGAKAEEKPKAAKAPRTAAKPKAAKAAKPAGEEAKPKAKPRAKAAAKPAAKKPSSK